MTATASPAAVTIKNVLLATDLSQASETAFRFAQAIAQRHEAQLHSLFVAGAYYQLLEPEPLNITFREMPEARARPTEALQRLFRGLPTQLPLEAGEIWQVVNEVIRRREIDLLVVGTHARHGLDRLIHGSVAEEVLRNANCPVLTVGPDAELSGDGKFDIARILLATDFDSQSEAPRYAAELCNQHHAQLTILHVTQKAAAAKGTISRRLEQVRENLDVSSNPDLILEEGETAEAILRIAGQLHPELIVLGARRPEPAKINSHLPRPTFASVVGEAKCPVLTVRQTG
jgi:nucleotide-binding universal stress UspA family protein